MDFKLSTISSINLQYERLLPSTQAFLLWRSPHQVALTCTGLWRASSSVSCSLPNKLTIKWKPSNITSQ
uniref:Uncharacterized protein n=1 Tax=Manihot esculenta TaxID=3983 RepID=A0A2C9UAW5_MANES